MKSTAHNFTAQAAVALKDVQLQRALAKARGGFVDRRRAAVGALPEFDALRDAASAIREHTLDHLDYYLERFEQRLTAKGGKLHWARTAQDACRVVVDLCRNAKARHIAKGKSMVAEEIGLNEALQQAGFEVTETDLGEYIIQLAHEPPSHIIAPAVHKTRDQIADLFHAHHARYGLTQRHVEVPALVNEARTVLRRRFLEADAGITGANFLVAETGSCVVVTNEGNGDLSATLPRVHIVIAGVDKLVPTLDDSAVLLRLLARSATGQEMTAYTTFFTGPRRPEDLDGPEEFHVVLVDNGRSEMLGGEFRAMLLCIRCGACLNHCPVYNAVGGHAYGWVYPGPMGAVLTPLLLGLPHAVDLPNASTLCGRCEEVCPVRIPLPQLLRGLRERAHRAGLSSRRAALGLKLWAFLAKRPLLYRGVMRLAARWLHTLGRRAGRFKRLPLAGGWTAARDFPTPQGETFQALWKKHRGGKQ